MYQPTYPTSSPSPYTSPPLPPDAYRSSPIPVGNARQSYAGSFSPPPIPPQVGGYPAIPTAQAQRYQQYARQSPPIGGAGIQQHQQPPRSGGSSRQQRVPGQNGYAQQSLPQPPAQSQPQPARHKGTIPPGQIVTVGEHTVKVERYLSEGGYAHVYLTSSEKPIYPPTPPSQDKKGRWGEKGFTQHCLKRIAFEDDSVWTEVKKEIAVMKALPPTPHLVQYLGSTHTRNAKGGHEVFILMEFAAGGGIIDLLNKRLRDRLKEIEILNIFTDVCEAVAAMHALKQPLLHRDLKIENVLSHPSSAPPSPQRPTPLVFKLCDFGSTTFPASHPPATKVEADALALDLNRHTTLQYRSPEMVEPMLGLPVGLPSDVWALGVLLYKLCYYTTPFEEHGTLAIVNAKYTFPQFPVYSPRIQHLIASMLLEQPMRRPNVFEVLKISHDMSGTRPEIDYPDSSSRSIHNASSTSSSRAPPSSGTSNTSGNLLDFTSPPPSASSTPLHAQAPLVNTVQPGRRGRPTREAGPSVSPAPAQSQQPSSQPRLQVTGDRNVQKSSGSSDAFSGIDKMAASSTSKQWHSQQFSAPQNQGQSQKAGLRVPQAQTQARPGVKSPSPSSSLDAFGMPKQGSSSPGPGGFGDSFGSKPFQPTSRFGQSLATQPSGAAGFGDSFGSSSRSATPAAKSAVPETSDSSGKESRAPNTSEATKNPRPTTESPPTSGANANTDITFETRFPSIETLSTGALSPEAENLLFSPIVSPPASRPGIDTRPSIMGSLTGGIVPSPHTAAPLVNGAPQARSTNVTGTAFHTSSTLSPDTLRSEYFQITESADTQTSPVDLMAGDDVSLLHAPSLKPVLSGSSTTTRISRGSVDNDLQQPITLHPSQSVPTQSRAQLSQPDSSDEEGPESASNALLAPSSSNAPRSRSMASSPSMTMAERKAAFQARAETSQRQRTSPSKSATTPLPADAQYRPMPSREASSSRNRPQSMYTLPSSGSSSTAMSLAAPPSSTTTTATGARPAHTRKGSINDIVTKFEGLSPAPSPSKPTSSAGLSSRPTVAAKPPAFRKTTLDTASVSTLNPSNSSPAVSSSYADLTSAPVRSVSKGPLPPKPTKPTTFKPPTSSTSQSTTSASSSAPASVPLNTAAGTKHADAPRPDGFSRSSSGRSFPITKPKPVTINSGNAEASAKAMTSENDRGSASESGSGTREKSRSPDERQPVNALIARWNKGEVGTKPALKAKPVI